MWILDSSSHVPIPLIQGWVMFASVFCFVATTVLAFLYVIGAHGNRTSWITLVSPVHVWGQGVVMDALPREVGFPSAG